MVLSPGNYSWIKFAGFYLVGKAEPTSPNFLRFATTHIVKPSYLPADKLLTLLPNRRSPLRQGLARELFMTITASPSLSERIIADIGLLDHEPSRIMLEAMVTEVTSETLNQYSFPGSGSRSA